MLVNTAEVSVNSAQSDDVSEYCSGENINVEGHIAIDNGNLRLCSSYAEADVSTFVPLFASLCCLTSMYLHISYIDIGITRRNLKAVLVGKSKWARPAGKESKSKHLCQCHARTMEYNVKPSNIFHGLIYIQEFMKNEWLQVKVICIEPLKQL